MNTVTQMVSKVMEEMKEGSSASIVTPQGSFSIEKNPPYKFKVDEAHAAEHN